MLHRDAFTLFHQVILPSNFFLLENLLPENEPQNRKHEKKILRKSAASNFLSN